MVVFVTTTETGKGALNPLVQYLTIRPSLFDRKDIGYAWGIGK